MATPGKSLFLPALSLAWLGAVVGCGARTDTLFDDSGGGSSGSFNVGGQPHGGGSPSAGSNGFAGVANQGGFGGRGQAGSGGFAGAFPTAGTGAGGSATAGSFGLGGAFPAGGRGGFGGSLPTAGSSPSAGAPPGGSFGTGGFGGEAGVAGTGGVVELCVASAKNACDKCTCQTCGAALGTCFNDGCGPIVACVISTQCQGLGCYQDSTCRGVINDNGGPFGGPLSEALSLVTCTVGSRSSCGCN